MMHRGRRFALAVILLLTLSGAALLAFREKQSAPARFTTVIEEIDRGDTSQAAAALKDFESRPETSDYAAIIDGALLLKGAAPQLALNRIAHIDPQGVKRRPALLVAAEAYYQLKRLVDAERLLTTLLVEQPNDVEAMRWLSAVYYDLGAFDAASSVLRRLSELAPDDYRPHRLLGLMNLDFEEYSEAATQYEESLRRSPPTAVRDEVLIGLGRSLIALRRYDDALSRLREASPSAESLALQARCELNLGRLAEARTILDSASDRNPEDREVLLLGSELELEARHNDRAIELLRRSLKLFPHDLQCRYRLATALQKNGDQEEAQAELKKWQEMNDLTKRLSDLNREAVAKPRDAAIRDELARICDELSRPELARMWRDAAAACRAQPPSIDPASGAPLGGP
jgi:tetratricopeptide (TPR) repeat protein